MDVFDHHRNLCTRAWIVPELGNRHTGIIEDDVIVTLNTGGGERDVSTCTLTKHGNLVTIHTMRVAILGNGLAEVTDGRTAVLYSAVSGLDELQRALVLGLGEWVPSQTVVAARDHISFLGELRADGHGAAVVLVTDGTAVHVLREEITRVEIQNERAFREDVTGGLIDVAHQRLGRGGQTLQGRDDRDVRTIDDVGGDVDFVEHFIDVAHTIVVDLTFGHETQGQSHTGRVVVHNLVNPEHGLCLSHGRVQRERRRKDVGTVGIIICLNRSLIEPLPGRSIGGLGGNTIHVIVQDREESIPSIVVGRSGICDIRIRERRIVVRGVTVDLLVNIVGTAHLYDRLIRRRNDEDGGLIGSKGVMGALETDHGNVPLVEPVQVAQGTAEVELEIECGTVSHMVGHAELETTHFCWSVGIIRGIRVTVDVLHHHRNLTARAGIVPELGNRHTAVVEDDVVVAGDTGRSQRDVATGPVSTKGNFGVIDAVGIAILGHRLAEVTHSRAAVLNTTVSGLNQLKRTLLLGFGKRIPSETVIHTGHDISHLGISGADFNDGTVGLGTLRPTV